MIKLEEIEKMMNSENAPVIAGIGGIVIMVGIDRVTRNRYRVEGKKDSITIEPAVELPVAPEKDKPAAKSRVKKTKA